MTTRHTWPWVAQFALLATGALVSHSARSAELTAVVTDEGGKPVQDAVVYLLGAQGSPLVTRRAPGVVMDQQDLEFTPYVLPVQVGTSVRFPNRDNVRHHVYSVAPTKRFELPLYQGTAAGPVVFDKPGVVPLGCNIHDWMVAYVLVLETPLFATTDGSGHAVVREVAAGTYQVRVWHPLMRATPESTARPLALAVSGARAAFTLALKPDLRIRRNPPLGEGSYP